MIHTNTPNFILDLKPEDLIDTIEGWGKSSYRATQIWDGLYKQYWRYPSEFTNLPVSFHKILEREFIFQSLVPDTVLDAIDGQTTKTLFKAEDGLGIEAVLMEH